MLWILAEAGGSGGGGSGGGMQNLLVTFVVPMALFIYVIYMLMIRPQKQKENTRKEMISKLKKKDWVYTIGGLHGQVVDLTEDTVTLRVDPARDVKVKFQRTAVASITKSADAEPSGETEKP